MKKVKCIHVVIALVALLIVVVMCTGCGGGSDTAAASGSLTRAQFIRRASAICRKEEPEKVRRLESVVKPGKGLFGASPHELEKMSVEVVLPLYSELIEEFASLRPPAKDAATVDRFLRILRSALKDSEAHPHELISRDPFAPANEVAAEYGIEGCSL